VARTKTIEVTRFKKQCLTLLEKVPPEGLVITRHGTPVARVVPYARQPADLIGSLRNKIRVRGDLFSTGVRR
jgi:prevent-host-death family protein